jgi:hypothetical protein
MAGDEERLKALEAQREKQQGLGRPIISTAMGDTRFVAVGKNVQYAKNWKTFHDFLRHFFLDTLGRGWLKAQAALPPELQHIVLRWHDRATNRRTLSLSPPQPSKPRPSFSLQARFAADACVRLGSGAAEPLFA